MWLERVSEVDWSRGGEAEGATARLLRDLAAEIIEGIKVWQQGTAEDDGKNLEDCTKALDHVCNALDMADGASNPCVRVLLENLCAVDACLLETAALHFRLISSVWKGCIKVVKANSRCLDEDICANLLVTCMKRLEVQLGRNEDEMKKMRGYFLNQFAKLVDCNLTVLPTQAKELITRAVSLTNQQEVLSSLAKLKGLAVEDCVELINLVNCDTIEKVSFDWLDLDNLPSVLSKLRGRNFDVLAREMAKRFSCSQLYSLLEKDDINVQTFCVTVRALQRCCEEPQHSFVERMVNHLLRGLERDIASEIDDKVGKYSRDVETRSTLLTRHLWSWCSTQVITVLQSMDPIKFPYRLLDLARVRFILLSPCDISLDSLHSSVQPRPQPDPKHVMNQCRAQEYILPVLVEAFWCLPLRLRHPSSLSLQSLKELVSVIPDSCLSFIPLARSVEELSACLEVGLSSQLSSVSVIRSIKDSWILQQPVSDVNLLTLIGTLIRKACTSAQTSEEREALLHSIAALCSVADAHTLAIKFWMGPELSAQFCNFLRTGRRPTLSRNEAAPSTIKSTSLVLASPPGRKRRIDDNPLRALKRLCDCAVDLNELCDIENQVANIIQAAKASRGVL